MTEIDDRNEPNEIYKILRIQDSRDLNAGNVGLNIKRIKHFLSPYARDVIENRKNEKSRNELTMLDILLMSDPIYSALYSHVMDRIDQIEDAVNRNLDILNQHLAKLEEHIDDMHGRAFQLSDGTRVYKSKDGHAYTEDGNKISDHDISLITWDRNHPSWEEYITTRDNLEHTQKQKQEVESYRDNVLESAKERMLDRENPPDKDELPDILDNLENKIPPQTTLFIQNSDAQSNSELMSTFHQKADGKQIESDATHMDIPDFGLPVSIEISMKNHTPV